MTTLFFQPQWSEFETFFRQIDEILEGATRPATRSTRHPSATSSQPANAQPAKNQPAKAQPTKVIAWKPRAALRNLSDRYELQFQLSGIDPAQIDIEASRDSIRLKGDRKAPEGEAVLHSEFRYGPFERHFKLSEEIQHQSVSASYEQGILTLRLPKRSVAEDYRVKVAIAGADASASPSAPLTTESEVDKPIAAASDDVRPDVKSESSPDGNTEPGTEQNTELDSVW